MVAVLGFQGQDFDFHLKKQVEPTQYDDYKGTTLFILFMDGQKGLVELLRCIGNAVPAGLSWLGRQGTRAIAAIVIVGIAFPWVGEHLKAYVGEAIFVLLSIAFMRVNMTSARACLRRPELVLAATAWTAPVPLTAPLFASILLLLSFRSFWHPVFSNL